LLTRGRRLALVGESGSGKSTLLALLRGLYEPKPGYSVTVDGRSCGLGSLNETTTLFPQEPEIFENTIEYNVTLGLPVGEAEVRRVCEVAHFAAVNRGATARTGLRYPGEGGKPVRRAAAAFSAGAQAFLPRRPATWCCRRAHLERRSEDRVADL